MKIVTKLACFLVIASLILALPGQNGQAKDDLSPVVPSLASFILPGAGQLINDQPDKALTHFIVILGIDTATYFLSTSLIGSRIITYRLGTTLHLAWSGYSAYDAYQEAKNRNSGIFSSAPGPDRFSEDKSLSLVSSTRQETLPEFSVSRNLGNREL